MIPLVFQWFLEVDRDTETDRQVHLNTVDSTVSGHRQFTFRKTYLFFPNEKSISIF